MCNAVAAMAGVTAAGAGLSIYSQVKQGGFDAKVAENNARIAGYQRAAALRAGESAASQVRDEGRRVTGAATAALAKGNVSSTVGSGADILATTEMMTAADAATAKANAAREAWGYGQQRRDSMAEAAMRKRAGIMGGIGTGLGAVGSILKSAG